MFVCSSPAHPRSGPTHPKVAVSDDIRQYVLASGGRVQHSALSVTLAFLTVFSDIVVVIDTSDSDKRWHKRYRDAGCSGSDNLYIK